MMCKDLWMLQKGMDLSKIFSEVEEFQTKLSSQRRCLYGLCPSLKSWHSLCRKAKKIAQRVLNLKLDEGLCDSVANPPPLEKPGSIISGDDFKGFESRKAVMNDVLIALRNEKSRIIGRDHNDEVVLATVSTTADIKTIQTETAESLGMKFVEESESIRAQKLHERIKQSKRILIILDDVWAKLKFEAIGDSFWCCT
ncbi:putative disease resistance protein [Prunus yedoensis var. nudiflora]|uniref:Putative disease resistance protein n=1 Tax=Prunus yedoensis var. nudiflora TaxID=2094558 RepID=A0A314ZI00_PRUYE|nr:putative disease resistance protein [Prunus yedoensis var. nudiflora]